MLTQQLCVPKHANFFLQLSLFRVLFLSYISWSLVYVELLWITDSTESILGRGTSLDDCLRETLAAQDQCASPISWQKFRAESRPRLHRKGTPCWFPNGLNIKTKSPFTCFDLHFRRVQSTQLVKNSLPSQNYIMNISLQKKQNGGKFSKKVVLTWRRSCCPSCRPPPRRPRGPRPPPPLAPPPAASSSCTPAPHPYTLHLCTPAPPRPEKKTKKSSTGIFWIEISPNIWLNKKIYISRQSQFFLLTTT